MSRLDKLREEQRRELTAGRTTTAAARSGFAGQWRLHRGKSTFNVSWRREGLDGREGSAPELRTLSIAPGRDGALAFTIDTQIVANDTGFFRVEYTAKPDGTDSAVRGGAIDTFVVRRVDANTLERTGKIKGAVVETGTWTLSPDQKTLTVTAQGEVEGAKYSNVQVFERVE
jgi:hypothetical protein